jgi:hypothetical protein
MKWRNLALVSLLAAAGLSANASGAMPNAAQVVIAQIIAQAMAQAMVPPTGADDAAHPMPMNERMERRFPQLVRVGDLAGLPVLDDRASTIGFVRQVVRTPQGAIELIVSCGGWFGRGSRLVAVPIQVVGIEGRQLVSLDMPRGDYAAAPTWQDTDATVLPDDASIRIALVRN